MGDYSELEDKEVEELEWVKEEIKKFKEEYDKNYDGNFEIEEVSFILVFLFIGELMCKIRCLV